MLQKKSPQKLWGLLFVWRSGRDSNSRPHAWQACILTKLNYRTVFTMKKTSLFFSNAGAKVQLFSELASKKTNIFWKNITYCCMSEHYKITFFSITSPNTPQNKSNNPRFFKKSCLHSTQNSTPITLFKETALKLFTIQKKELPFHRPNTTKFISTYHLHSTHPPSTGCEVHLSKSRPNDRFVLNPNRSLGFMPD